MLFSTSLLGVQIFSIDFGWFQLSPYRALILLSPFLVLHVKKRSLILLKQGQNYKYFYFLTVWVFYSLLSILWIKDFSGWAKMFSFLCSGFITSWFIGWHFCFKEDIIKALKITEFFSLLFGLIALYEIVTGNYLFLSDKSLSFYQERSILESTVGLRIPVSVFDNANNYALFLIFPIFCSLALSQIKKTFLGKFWSLILSFSFIVLLFLTQSRSALLGLGLGFTAIFLIKIIKGNFNKKLIFFILLTLGSLSALPWLLSHSYFYEALIAFDITQAGGSDAIRINLIKNGLVFLFDTLLAGVGLGNIEYYMKYHTLYNTGGIINIHNWWMEILVTSGIFIFIFYLILYIKNSYKLYYYSIKKEDDYPAVSECFFGIMVAFVFASIAVSSLMNSEWYWGLMAIIMSYLNLFQKNSKN